jgi:GT2 family glycosyltransferase
MDLSVSVIVPTYGREQVLVDTLECILNQDYASYEILVIDQTPQHEPSVERYLMDAKKENRIRYYHMDTPTSPGSRNFGAQLAEGDLLLLVDDDVLLEPDWINNHARHYSDPRIGAVVGRIVHPPKLDLGVPNQPTGIFLRDGSCTAGFGRQEACFIDTGGGGNMSVRRALYMKIGGYDEAYVGNAFREESDFALRLRKDGHLIFFDPEAQIIHLKSPSGGHRRSSPGQALVFRYNMQNEIRFFLKNFPRHDLPHFLWRFRRELLLPALRMGLATCRLKDVFPAQIGVLCGIIGYIKEPHTQSNLNIT